MLQVVRKDEGLTLQTSEVESYMGASQSRDTLRNFLSSLASPGFFLWRTWETVFPVSQDSAFILISFLRLPWRIQKSLSPLHPLLENKSEFKGQKQCAGGWLCAFCFDLGVRWSWPCFHTTHLNFTLEYKIVLEISLEESIMEFWGVICCLKCMWDVKK